MKIEARETKIKKVQGHRVKTTILTCRINWPKNLMRFDFYKCCLWQLNRSFGGTNFWIEVECQSHCVCQRFISNFIDLFNFVEKELKNMQNDWKIIQNMFCCWRLIQRRFTAHLLDGNTSRFSQFTWFVISLRNSWVQLSI
jgi:hypothetical protein